MPKGLEKGHKQSVRQKNSSKRRKNFKGVPKHENRRVKPTRTVSIAFVGDDDVVSERVPPPPTPASIRKLVQSDDSSSSDESLVIGDETAEGYRLISIDSLKEFADRLHSHSSCESGSVEIFESSSNRFGLSSSLYAVCDTCGMNEFLATGHHNTADTVPRTIQGKDINRRMVYGACEVGLGRENIIQLCELLNMPFSMAKETWHKHEDILHEAHVEVVKQQMSKNRVEARMAALLDEGRDENDSEAVVEVPISFDGTWSKRGYTANHGVGFIISASTGKVLDFECVSKTCSQCTQKKASLSEDAFEAWFEGHDCSGSYDGSSPGMEVECAKQLWGRSLEYNVMYKYMISDGDSKSYGAIWDCYGACETCLHYEALNHSSEEFRTWRQSDKYKKWETAHLQGATDCNRVLKLDCIGHVQKRMGKALYELQKSSKKLEDGKPMKGRNGRLTKTAIEKLKKYYGKAIRNNVKRNISSSEEQEKAVQAMKTEIQAGMYHCLKLPPKERHKFCPTNSWCKYKKGLKLDDKPYYLDGVFKNYLQVIYDRLSDPALLSRCLPGYTQNANESINSLVWLRCPKHKWFGTKRVEMAAAASALHFSSGATAKHEVMEHVGLQVGSHTVQASKRRDSNRVKQAEKRSSDAHKAYRQLRSLAKKRDEGLQVEREGTTYLAGGFNELDLCAAPQKKRKK